MRFSRLRLRTQSMKLPNGPPGWSENSTSASGSPFFFPLAKNLPSLMTPSSVWNSLVIFAVPAVDQSAVLEDDLRPAEVDDGQLRVRRLALVLVAEAAAQADALVRHGPLGHRPAGNVHLMHPLVADLAVAEVPEPVPVVVNQIFVVRLLRRGPEPKVEVQPLRWRLRRFQSDAPPRLAGVAVRNQQPAILPAVDGRDLPGPLRVGAILRAVLDDATVLPRASTSLRPSEMLWLHGFSTYTSLPDWQAHMPSSECQWFGAAIETTSKSLSSKIVAEILDALGRIAAAVLHHFAARSEQAAVGIDQIRDLDVLHAAICLNMLHAAAVNAGHRDANPIVGAQHPARSLCAADGKRGGDESTGRGPLQKITAIVARHDSLPACGVRRGSGGVGVAATRGELAHLPFQAGDNKMSSYRGWREKTCTTIPSRTRTTEPTTTSSTFSG